MFDVSDETYLDFSDERCHFSRELGNRRRAKIKSLSRCPRDDESVMFRFLHARLFLIS